MSALTINERIVAAVAIPMSVEEIAEATGLTSRQIYNSVYMLKKDGLIEKTDTGLYVAVGGAKPDANNSKNYSEIIHAAKPVVSEEVVLLQIDELAERLIVDKQPVINIRIKQAALIKLAALMAGDVAELLYSVKEDVERLAGIVGQA